MVSYNQRRKVLPLCRREAPADAGLVLLPEQVAQQKRGRVKPSPSPLHYNKIREAATVQSGGQFRESRVSGGGAGEVAIFTLMR